jgi:hypothetical protein
MQLQDITTGGAVTAAESAALARDRYLSVTDAAAFLGVSVSWLNRLRGNGGGPAFSKLSPRGRVTYRLGDLIDWATAHRRTSTSDIAGAATSGKAA